MLRWHDVCILAIFCLLGSVCERSVGASDFSVVPLLDGERDGDLNYWGGPFSTLNLNGIAKQSSIVHSGNNAYQINLGNLPASTISFFQSFSSERTGTEARRQTRDLTRYEGFEGYFRNDTNAPLNIRLELKDYRDSNSHRASKTFIIPTGGAWTKIDSSFNLNAGWSVSGSPDISRTYIASFVMDPQPAAVSGSYYLDDFSLVEPGGSVDPQTAPIDMLVERLARRQFEGLWSGRNRTTGLIYNHKDDVGIAAMNTTGGTLWMLPNAVKRGWVTQAEADSVVGQIVSSLNTNLNQSSYVPTRFIDPVSAALPGGENEESSIDSSFIALALHNYKTQTTTNPALAAQIGAVQNRFQLDAFSVSNGFRLAYRPASGFSGGTYNGYTNEGKVISLAAEVSDDHHVPLEANWNADINRAKTSLVNVADSHLVHSSTLFRAPFEQALLNLFVDTSERGVDNYPVRTLATNPWQNFVRYEREVAAKLDQLGRDIFFQPDAASGAPFSSYQQYSLYNDFGQPDLFMPWSVAFAMLAGADGSEEAFRSLLEIDGVSGPLGIADTVRWNTGEAEPYFVSNSGDNWNTVLMTMALLEYLDHLQGVESGSQFFASLAGVSSALDEVFVDGDLNGDGVTNGSDLAIWQNGYGTPFNASPASGDTDGDGDVDGRDFLRWQRGISNGAGPVGAMAVPEPANCALFVLSVVGLLAGRNRNLKNLLPANGRE